MRMVYFLVALALLFPLTILTSYLIAVLLGHVQADFPYISDTGTYVPESCIFGQMLNMSAGLFAFVAYLRCLQLWHYIRTLDMNKLRWIPICSLVFGWTAAFGMSLVANFQVSNVFVVHMIGAFLAFCVPILYMLFDIIISFKVAPMVVSMGFGIVRTVLLFIYVAAFLNTYIFSRLAGELFTGDDYHFWQPEDGGWEYHLVSTTFEWVMGIVILLYMVTYYREFHESHVFTPLVKTEKSLLTPPASLDDMGNQYGTLPRSLHIDQVAL